MTLQFAAVTPTQLRRRDCTQPAPRFYHHHRHGIRPPNRRSRARAAPLPLSNVDHLLTDGAQKHQRWLTATSGASEQREQRLASTWATLARKPHQNRASRPVAGPMGSLQRQPRDLYKSRNWSLWTSQKSFRHRISSYQVTVLFKATAVAFLCHFGAACVELLSDLNGPHTTCELPNEMCK